MLFGSRICPDSQRTHANPLTRARPHPTPPLLKLNLNPNVTPRLLLLPPPRSQLLWERARRCHRRRCRRRIRARRRRLGSRRRRCRPAVAGDAHAARRRRRCASRRHRWRRRLAGSSPPVLPCGRPRPVSASLPLRPSTAGPRPAGVAPPLTGPLTIHLQAARRPSLDLVLLVGWWPPAAGVIQEASDAVIP